MSIRNWRRCIKCGKHFDIATNHELCPECRNENLKQKRGRKKR